MRNESVVTDAEIERLQKLAAEGKDLQTGQPAPDFRRKCRKCGVRNATEGKVFCGECRNKYIYRHQHKRQEVDMKTAGTGNREQGTGKTTTDTPPVGGQAADGVPAARPMRPGADPVGKKERLCPPSQTGTCACGATVSQPGGRCRTCAGLARRGKAHKTPTAAPAARLPERTAPKASGPAAAATGLPGPASPVHKGSIEREAILKGIGDREATARAVRVAAFRLLYRGAQMNKEWDAATYIEQALDLLKAEDLVLGRKPIRLVDEPEL